MSEQDEIVGKTEEKKAENAEKTDSPGLSEKPERKERPERKEEPERKESPERKETSGQGERPKPRKGPEQGERTGQRRIPEQGERPVRRDDSGQRERPVRRVDSERQERPVRRDDAERRERPVLRDDAEQPERTAQRRRPPEDDRDGESVPRRRSPEDDRDGVPQRRRPPRDDQEEFERWARARDRRMREQQEKERKKKKTKKILKWTLLPIAILFLLFVMGTLAVNGYMLLVERRNIMTADEWSDYVIDADTDCILVLGCSVIGNSEPSDDLKGRLEMALELYRRSPHKILVSGDHSADGYYNEVQVMKDYLVERGVPSSDVFMDHYGFSTYDSIYRARYSFGVRKITIVTQEFHLYRSVFIARATGMETVGVASATDKKVKVSNWTMREVFARDKDFLSTLFWPDPVMTGDSYDIHGDGDVTNDR